MNRREFCHMFPLTGASLAGVVRRPITQAGSAPTGLSPSAASPPFLYILRLAMAPGLREDERVDALLSFCRQAQIDDVAFILWAEELNTGHPTPEEVEPWLRMVERVKPRLAEAGVTTSLNPWVVLLHADRGRVLKPGQSLRLMVDRRGRMASATACPLDPALHNHLRKHYERLAAVRPRIIWVDDDFRLHNHAPLEWGGCFCDLHMQEYSRRAGRRLTREEFASGVLQPGTPHPFRRIWLETSRDTMVNLARILGEAVRRVSPDTLVGLMSSSPAVHSIEGRDWEQVLRGLAAGKPPVNRPHLPSYTETTGPQYLWDFTRVSRLSAASVPPDTLLYPELENWPHSRFSKSRAFTRFQIESAAALGPAGITMDIFDLFGNGAMAQEGYAPILVQAKALAAKLREQKLDPRRETGVEVLFNPDASYSLWTEKGESFSELAPDDSFWAAFFAVMGVAHTYRRYADQKNAVLAISGQYCRGLKESQVRNLLANNITFLNGDAVFTLYKMGLGNAIGVSGAEWVAGDSGIPSYEQVIDGRIYAGLRDARLTAQASTGDYLKIEYAADSPDLLIHTEVRDPSGRRSGPGMAVVRRRIVTLPYGRSASHQGLLHPVRQALVQTLLTELADNRCPLFLANTANVAVFTYELEGRRVILLVNASLDEYQELELRRISWSHEKAVEISSEGSRPLGDRLRAREGGLVLRPGLKPLEVKAIVFPQ